MFPVRIETPASAAVTPTWRANCRGCITTDPMGRVMFGDDGRWRNPGRDDAVETALGRTHDIPRFGALVRR